MKSYSLYIKTLLLLGGFFPLSYAFANDPNTLGVIAISESALLLTMGIVALSLLAVIAFLIAYPFYGVNKRDSHTHTLKVLALMGMASLMTMSSAFAQDTATDSSDVSFSKTVGLVIEKGIEAKWSAFDVGYWMLFIVILIEACIIFAILGGYFYKIYLATVEEEDRIRVASGKKALSFWDRMNDTKTIEEERDIQLDHNYDGIKELDNSLPPWWKYGFYLTIVFACIYIWRYHLAHSAPLQLEELAEETRIGEEAAAAFLRKSANAIDENTVKLLTSESDIAAGKAVYLANCVVCHGGAGEGGVGPNFTDDYWLHKGGIQDLFKVIKYGVDGKGMKSWKEDLSPMKIAQVASFVKTLKGTNPPNGKEPQGELYEEKADSTQAVSPTPKDTTLGK